MWLFGFAAVLTNFDGIGNTSQAAPITFRFDATVRAPRQGFEMRLPPNWNLSLQEGDAISGTFTFEPFDATTGTSRSVLYQPFDFSIDIKSRTLSTSEYGIEVFDDRLLEDAPQPSDNINVGCSYLGGGVECMPRTVSVSDPVEWSFGFALFGEPRILDGADIPSDPLIWEQLLAEKTMLVTFTLPVGPQSYYGFQATIETFKVVPEPSTVGLVVFGSILIASIWHIFGLRSTRIAIRTQLDV
jgi:hypothetical protein